MGLFDFFKKEKPTSQPSANPPVTGFHSLTVSQVVRETPDAISIYLTIPPNLRTTFAYKAGQYVTLRLVLDGKPVLRSYSLSSCPITDDFFRIAVKRKVGGVLSGKLVDTLKVGDRLEVFPPLGHFTPNLNSPTTAYFLYAGGSGITPLLSIAKTVLAGSPTATVTLLYANRNEEQIIYRNEWTQLLQQYSARLSVYYILDAPPANWAGGQGIFRVADYVNWLQQADKDGLAAAEHFVCGPTPLMQTVEQALQQLEVPPNRIHIEYFEIEKQAHEHTAAEVATTIITATKSEGTTGNGTAATVVLEGKTHLVTIAKGDTILNTLLNVGLDAPFMCEAGVCSSCRAKLLSGQVQMRACYALSDKELADGYILTCQSEPQTNEIVVSYDE